MLFSIIIPSSCASIVESAFCGCTSLKEIAFSDGIAGIGASYFYGCTSVREISVPSSVVSIGSYAFAGCTSILRISFDDGIPTVVGDMAFNFNAGGDSLLIYGVFGESALMMDMYCGGKASFVSSEEGQVFIRCSSDESRCILDSNYILASKGARTMQMDPIS